MSSRLIRVLYVHHCGVFGGASRSLFELLENIQGKSVDGVLVTPPGPVEGYARALGLKVYCVSGLTKIDNYLVNVTPLREFLFWSREFIFLFFTIWIFLKIKLKETQKFDLVHLNEYSLGLPAILAKAVFRTPIVVHARSVQNAQSRIRAKVLRFIYSALEVQIVAIDRSVLNSLPQGLNTVLIYNGLNVGDSKREICESKPNLVVGFLGNFLRYKGIFEFVEAARMCTVERGLTGLHFAVYGASHRNNLSPIKFLANMLGVIEDVGGELTSFVQSQNLTEVVQFCGFQRDMSVVFNHVDVLCFPSYVEGAGRPVFEAAHYGIPSIVALSSHFGDTIIDGQTGIVIPPKDAIALADAIEELYMDRSKILKMGAAAQAFAKDKFCAKKNAAMLTDLYKKILKIIK